MKGHEKGDSLKRNFKNEIDIIILFNKTLRILCKSELRIS